MLDTSSLGVWFGNMPPSPLRVEWFLTPPARPLVSGGESLNTILAEGKNKLAKIHNILMRFRSKPGGFTCDVKMAYNQVRLDPSCYRYQKYLWKDNLDPSQPVTIMIVRTLIYGVKSSGNQLFSGFSKLAYYCIEHFLDHEAGAQALKDDGYVDDVIHSKHPGNIQLYCSQLKLHSWYCSTLC